MLYITCLCGLARLLPPATKAENGAIVELKPCPRCSYVFRGVYQDGHIITET